MESPNISLNKGTLASEEPGDEEMVQAPQTLDAPVDLADLEDDVDIAPTALQQQSQDSEDLRATQHAARRRLRRADEAATQPSANEHQDLEDEEDGLPSSPTKELSPAAQQEESEGPAEEEEDLAWDEEDEYAQNLGAALHAPSFLCSQPAQRSSQAPAQLASWHKEDS